MKKNPEPEIQAILDSQSNWKGELLAELRATILASDPEIVEVVKWKMPSKPLGSISFEMNGILCIQDYLKSAVRLTFPQGAFLEDPSALFNCRLDSKTTRGIDIGEGSNIDLDSLMGLVKSAIVYNQQVKGSK